MNDIRSLAAASSKRRFPSAGEILQALRIADRGAIAMACAALCGAVLLGLLTRPLFGHQPLYDELLHVFAARGLLATGAPVIADGNYDRAELFTLAVAWAFRHFGDTLIAARLPAWIAALALCGLVGAWVVRRAGLLPGLAAGVLFALNPWTLELSVFARFYTLHALAVTIVFIALYEAFARDRRPQIRGLFAVIAAVSAAVAWHLQITTLIAIGAAASGVLAVLVYDNAAALMKFVRARPVLSAGAVAGAVVIVAYVTVAAGLVGRLETAPLWAAGRATSIEYYNSVFARDLPLLWPLLPLAVLATLLVDRRLAIFCTVTVLAALAVHSIAAQKAPRYVFYLIPLLCVLWGCAFAKAMELLPALFDRTLPWARRAAPLLTLAVVTTLLVNSTEGRRAFRLLLDRESALEVLSYRGEADWTRAVPALKAAQAHAGTLVSSNAMKALHYLGDCDFELNASIVPETDTREEFGVDPRTGRPAISSAASLARVLDGFDRALVIVEHEKLGVSIGVPREVIALLDDRCRRMGVPNRSGIVAWSCERPRDAVPQAAR